MSVNAFPLASSGGKTDEAGDIVLSQYKSTDAIYITIAKLPAGTYFLTTPSTGNLSIYPYTGSAVGDKIVDIAGDGTRKTTKITFSNGISGLFISGTYLGPLVFQQIPEASAPTSVVEAQVAGTTILDYGDGTKWRPVRGANDYLLFNYNSQNPTFVNTNTNTSATSSTAIVGTGGTGSAVVAATNGSVIITTSGYHGTDYNSRIYYSTNGGASFTVAHTIPGIDYNNIARYHNGLFFVTSDKNGYNTGSTSYHTSTDGITWTTRTMPRTAAGTRVRYLNGLWILTSSDSGTVYTSPDAITWTQRANAPYTIANIFYLGGYYLINSGGGQWHRSTDLASWTLVIENSNWREGYAYDTTTTGIDNAVYIGDKLYIRGLDASGYWHIIIWTASSVTSGPSGSWAITSGASGLSYTVRASYPIVYNGQFYVLRDESPYSIYKVTVLSSSVSGNLSGAPSVLPNSEGSSIFFSKKFNRWYMSVQQDQAFYRAETTGRSGYVKWVKTISTADAFSKIIETPTSLGVVGSSKYWRSTDGINFTSYTTPYNGASYGGGYYNGFISLGSGTDRQTSVSYDDGLSFVSLYVQTSSVDGILAVPLSNGMYFIGMNSKKVLRTTNGATVSDMAFSLNANTAKNYSVNDCLIGYINSNTWNRTLPNGVMANFQFTVPFSASDGTIAQLGSLFVYMPSYDAASTNGNTYWTSTNCVTWTARTLLSQKRWQRAFGSDSHLFVSTTYDASNYQIDVATTSTIITI